MSRNTRFSQPFLLSSKCILSVVRNGVINHTGLRSFIGFGTLHHWMVSFVVRAFCLVKLDQLCLLKNYTAVCEAVEAVRNRSSGQSASDADSFLKRLLSCEFLVSAFICRHVLAYTRPLTVALQAKGCDLHKAHRMAQCLVKALDSERAADKFHSLWQTITKISSDLDIEPAKKRSVRMQRNRANPPVENIEGHYRVAYYYDHTTSHLKTRFPQGALPATHFLPSKLSEEIFAKIKHEFDAFLPHPSCFDSEVTTWKLHMAEWADTDTKVDLLSMCNLSQENRLFYPNIHAILLLLSLSVGSCSCERSFSALRRLKTWCLSSMSDKWLDSLALGYINISRRKMSCEPGIIPVTVEWHWPSM